MTKYNYKEKIYLLDINEDLVVEILTNKDDYFGLVEFANLHVNNEVPKEKLQKFLTIFSELTHKGYIEASNKSKDSFWITTKKWKQRKFFGRKIWNNIGWWLLFALAIYTCYLQFIALPKIESQNTTVSSPEKTIPLIQQDSGNSAASLKTQIDSPKTNFADSLPKHIDTPVLKQNPVYNKKAKE